MASVVNVYFRVIRYIQEGSSYASNSRFSRLFVFESVNLEHTCSDLYAGLDAIRYSNFISEIKQAFPELQENKSLVTKKFKLVFPMDDGNNILTETVRDFHAVIQLNKKRCLEGTPITLLVVESSTVPKLASNSIARIQSQTKRIQEILSKRTSDRSRKAGNSGTVLASASPDLMEKIARQDDKGNSSGPRPSARLNQEENMAGNMKKIIQQRLALEASAVASKIAKRDASAFKSTLEKFEGKSKEPETRTKSLNDNMLTLLSEHRYRDSTYGLVMPLRNKRTGSVWPQSDFEKEIENSKPEHTSSPTSDSFENLNSSSDLTEEKGLLSMVNPENKEEEFALSEDIVEIQMEDEPYVHVEESMMADTTVDCAATQQQVIVPSKVFNVTEDVIGFSSRDLDDSASVKSESSDSSYSDSVWIMDDMVDATSSIQETIPIKKDAVEYIPSHPTLIGVALEKMEAMGFQNEGGWITRLLEVKGGDIAQVLDTIHFS